MALISMPTSFILILTLFCNLSSCSSAGQEDTCINRACYPATENLLVGRKISATSTCGLAGHQRYCNGTKCFTCDSGPPLMDNASPVRHSHRIEMAVGRVGRWWQSENGVQVGRELCSCNLPKSTYSAECLHSRRLGSRIPLHPTEHQVPLPSPGRNAHRALE